MPNFVTTSLPEYVATNRDLILKTFGLSGKGTRGRISLRTGIKGSEYISFLDVDPTLQDGSGCGFNAAGDATLSQKLLKTAAIKVDMEFCERTLLNKYAEYLVRVNANGAGEMPFEEYVVRGLLDAINKKIEKLIWQGDIEQTNNTDLKWINGILEQAGDDASVVKPTITAGAGIYEAIKAVYLAIPEGALERDPEIYVSPALYREFLQALVEKNLYHYPSASEEYPDFLYFPGSNVKVVKTDGLSGSRNIVGTFPENLVYGTDMEGDAEDFKIWFSNDADIWRVKVLWNSGATYYFPEQLVVANFPE